MVTSPEGANADQVSFWSGPSGISWINHEDEMDALLSSANRLLLERAGDVRGLDVLDIGCGTGALSLALADAGANVTASDISEPLLARAQERGNGRIKTLLADAQTATWDRQFDFVVSRFGVMFFENPAEAFLNIARAIRSGGRAVFVAWGPFEQNLWWRMPQSIAADVLGVVPDASDPHLPGPMGLSDLEWAVSRLASSSWSDVECEIVDTTLDHPAGAVAAGTLATHVGPAARVLRMHDAGDAQRKAVAAQISEALTTLEDGGTVRIPARLHIFRAIKA